MKVVLVNPPSTTEERYGVHFRSGGMTPPLGLACLASVIREYGHDVRVVDGALSNNYQEVVNDILSEYPQYVGITASTMSVHNANKIARMVKQSGLLVTTIIGGPHLTAVPEETMDKFPEFDIGVIGEAERTIVELLDTLIDNKDISLVKGIIHRYDGQPKRTPTREYINDLDGLPMPAWDLLPDLVKNYCPPAHTVKRIPAALLVTSRGCPGKCTFCDRSVFGNEIRAYSAGYVLGMMHLLHDHYGIREFQFRDDNFLAFRKRLVDMCTMLASDRLDVTWSVAGRVDMVNLEILGMMKSAGCWQIWYGVESGSQRILDSIQKQTTLEKIERAVKMTRDAGIEVGGFFMLGMPTETGEDVEATIQLSRKLELNDAHFTFFTPLPGCEVHKTAKQYGTFDSDWQKANMWNPVFVPSTMTEETLVRYWKRATMGFYLRPRVILSYARKIRSWRHIKVYLSGVLSLLEAVFVKKYHKESKA